MAFSCSKICLCSFEEGRAVSWSPSVESTKGDEPKWVFRVNWRHLGEDIVPWVLSLFSTSVYLKYQGRLENPNRLCSVTLFTMQFRRTVPRRLLVPWCNSNPGTFWWTPEVWEAIRLRRQVDWLLFKRNQGPSWYSPAVSIWLKQRMNDCRMEWDEQRNEVSSAVIWAPLVCCGIGRAVIKQSY